MLQILPYTWTGIIAQVLSVINASNLFTSIVYVIGSISQKTGSNPFRTIACVVDAKVNGVVITSPDKFKACKDNSKAIWPFVIKSIFSTPKY